MRNRVNDSMRRIGFDFEFPVDEKMLEITAWMERGGVRLCVCRTSSIRSLSTTQRVPRVSQQTNCFNDGDFHWVTEETRQFMEKCGYGPRPRTNSRREGPTKLLITHSLSLSVAAKAWDTFSDHFYNCMKRGFFSLSTPVWVNFGKRQRPSYLLLRNHGSGRQRTSCVGLLRSEP